MIRNPGHRTAGAGVNGPKIFPTASRGSWRPVRGQGAREK